jgi:hypothetical protein
MCDSIVAFAGTNNSFSGAKPEIKNNKSRSSSQNHEKSANGGGRKGRGKKKDCPYSFSKFFVLNICSILNF